MLFHEKTACTAKKEDFKNTHWDIQFDLGDWNMEHIT